MRSSLYISIFLFITIFISNSSMAEGTKEVAPNASVIINGSNTTDIAALLIDHDEYNNFATYTNPDPSSRLNIHIQDPVNECILLGLSVGHLNASSPNPGLVNYEYRIKDPNGNIVFGPIVVNAGDQNINTWQEAFNGPFTLFGAGGYIDVNVSSADLTSQGWTTSGDYYIEFRNLSTSSEFLIDFWDFSVINCQSTFPEYKPGRIWSYNWAFFAINDFGFPVRPFNGSFHVCAPDPDDNDRAFITKIDFNNSGFRPAAFNVAFNSFGSESTGSIEANRRSKQSTNSTKSEYEIFLNDPVDLCETALSGEISLLGVSRCTDSDYCIKFSTTKEGQVDLLLDFDANDNVYTPGTADIQISQSVSASDVNKPTCIDWNGLDGLGNPLPEDAATVIPITIAFAQGIYHFPIYDAELMNNGFNISSVRPTGPTPKLFYDDSEIDAPSGSGEPDIQLSGCTLPCHRWTNYTTSTAVGFGNLNTINSWWFSQLLVEEELIFLPGYYAGLIDGQDTICGDQLDTLILQLTALPVGVAEPTLISQIWTGPGIVGTNIGSTVIVNEEGIYNVEVVWENNLGDECRVNFTKNITKNNDCCSVSMQCTQDSVWYACGENPPPPFTSPEELIAEGLLTVIDQECATLALSVAISIDGTDCATDPKVTNYAYDVWNDANGNGEMDADEEQTNCNQYFLTSDMIPPTIEFSGDLLGMESGDTLFIECQASDPDWSIPMPTIDDILAIDDCGIVDVIMADEITEGDCLNEGFIKRYRCSWIAKDECGNETEIFIYMMLVDRTPPVITDVAEDITISCDAEFPAPYSEAKDACNCSHMEITIDTTSFHCPSDYVIKRTYTWSDHCGNSSSASQLITVEETNELLIILPDAMVDGEEIHVNCEDGTFPLWITNFNENSIDVFSSCLTYEVDFNFNQIESGDCSSGYLVKYEVSWTVVDDCNREKTASIVLVLVDHEPPVILAYPEADCTGEFDPNGLIVEDNCSVARIEHFSDEIGSQCDGVTSVRHSWYVYDQCDNSTYGEFILNQGDLEPPVLNLLPPFSHLPSGSTIYVDCDFDLSQINIDNWVEGFDNCGSLKISSQCELIENKNCTLGHLGIYKIIFLGFDLCGNSTEFILYINVQAPDLVNLISNEIINLTCGEEIPQPEINVCVERIELKNEIIKSNCNGAVSFRAYDIIGLCGETISDTLWMNFTDNAPPVFEALPDYLCVNEKFPDVRAWDICDQAYVPINVYERREETCGLPLRVISYSAIDKCGNEARKDITIVPEELELTPSLYYEDIPVIPGTVSWPMIIENCPFELDPTKFRIEPSCPLLSLDINYNLIHQNCDSSEFFEDRYYTISIMSTCGQVNEFHLLVSLRDNEAPIFINTPEDVSICEEIFPDQPEIEVWDNCSENTVTQEQIILPGLPGLVEAFESWTATDACGNKRTYSRTVSNFQPPIFSIEVPGEIACHSSARLNSLIEDVGGPFHYSWKILQGECTIVQNQSNMDYVEVVMFGDSAIVTLTVTNAFGCQSEEQVIIYCSNKPTAPISENRTTKTRNLNVLIYPNPVNQTINFHSEQEIMECKILDTRGRILKTLSINKKAAKIDVSDISSGLIILELKDISGHQAMHKLIKI